MSSLNRIAAGQGGTAWAVGQAIPRTASGLMGAISMRWNGKSWVKEPPLSGQAAFYGVAVAPGGTPWVVGYWKTGTLIARWTGKSWTRVASPSPGPTSALETPAFSSATDGWAVGYIGPTTSAKTLILHWNGKTWRWEAVPLRRPGAQQGPAHPRIVAAIDSFRDERVLDASAPRPWHCSPGPIAARTPRSSSCAIRSPCSSG